MTDRIESGVVQFGDDWPGLFLRGDDAFALAQVLANARSFVHAQAPLLDGDLCAWRERAIAVQAPLTTANGWVRALPLRLRPIAECIAPTPESTLDEYRRLQAEQLVREAALEAAAKAHDDIADRMDLVWQRLTDAERAELNR